MHREELQRTQAGVQMVVIPTSTLEALTDGIETLKAMVGKLAEDQQKQGLTAEWLENEDARRFLGVSPKTWQNYRDKRVIPFSQFGRKIYVKRADLENFLQSCRVGR